MAFKDRKEYEEWIENGKIEEWQEGLNYKYVPDCDKCDCAELISKYENEGWRSVCKLCRICLGLGKFKTI